MATVRDLIHGSLRLIGAVASGENVEANEAQDAFTALNGMLASWSLERLYVFHIPRVTVPTVVGQDVYTWGTGGQITQPRPFKLERALLNLGVQVGASGPLEWPIAVWTQQEYEEAIWLKELPSIYPWGVYLESSYPLARLHVWPVPTTTTTSLVLFPWQELSQFASLDTVLEFPPGYERLLRYGLAVEIAPEYGLEPSQTILQIFQTAARNIKTINTVLPLMRQPIHSLTDVNFGVGGSRYDILSDGRG